MKYGVNMSNGIFVAVFITAFILGILLLIWAIGKHDKMSSDPTDDTYPPYRDQ
jgi:hypothetical protein